MSELISKNAKTLYTDFDYLERGKEFNTEKFNKYSNPEQGIELHNDDFVAKVSANTSLEDLDSYLRPYSKISAFNSACSYSMSRVLGETRDFIERKSVLGLGLIGLDGEESKCGGQVIKNVAGYDLRRLYLGSFNSLQIIDSAYIRLEKLPMLKMKLFAAIDDLASLDFLKLRKFFDFDFNYSESGLKFEFHKDFSISLIVEFCGSPDLLELRKARLGSELGFEFISEVETFAKDYMDTSKFIANYYLPPSQLQDFSQALILILDDLEENPEKYANQFDFDIAEIPGRVDLKVDLLASTLSLESKPFIFRAFQSLESMQLLRQKYKPILRISPVTFENRMIERELNFIKAKELDLLKNIKLKFDPDNLLNPGVFCHVGCHH